MFQQQTVFTWNKDQCQHRRTLSIDVECENMVNVLEENLAVITYLSYGQCENLHFPSTIPSLGVHYDWRNILALVNQ